MTKKRVVVAMSGGVDSSVAALLLKEAGYEVTGVHMLLAQEGERHEKNIQDLEETCRIIGIPLEVVDFRKEFDFCVIRYFYKDYSSGLTPNPCVVCNKEVKFGRLLKWAQGLGADYLATGHYARVEKDSSGFHLLKALSLENDQSYFLYRLGQDELSKILFLIGHQKSKDEVRALALAANLPVSGRPKSHDICFIPDGDYRSFVDRFIPPQPGDIVDIKRKVLGHHQGLSGYTVGQRQGLGISSRAGLYVLELDISNNRLIVGEREKLESQSVRLRDLSWVSGKAPESGEGITAKIRYRSKDVAVRLGINDNIAGVEFSELQFAVTPGQSCVFYRGDEVLGGGIIVRGK